MTDESPNQTYCRQYERSQKIEANLAVSCNRDVELKRLCEGFPFLYWNEIQAE